MFSGEECNVSLNSRVFNKQSENYFLDARNGPIKDRKAKAASTLQKSEALSTEGSWCTLQNERVLGRKNRPAGWKQGAPRVGGAEQVVKGEVLGEDCVPPQARRHSNSE